MDYEVEKLEWLSATSTRNFAAAEPLLDWLDLYGTSKGFKKDQSYGTYDERTDFPLFIMNKGIEFEDAVYKHLSTLVSVYPVLDQGKHSVDREMFEKTLEAMKNMEPLIYQAVLWNEENNTFGIADLLIRSDILFELFPDSITEEEAMIGTSNLGSDTLHYRVIDIKFTTLHFLSGGDLSSSGSAWGYMMQVYIYNKALGLMQGYTPPGGYILGRKWEQTSGGQTRRGRSCMDRLAYVPDDTVSTKGLLANAVNEACNWVRRVRSEGELWDVLPEPTIPELRPNMGSTSDQPWHSAKGQINSQLKDLTTLWQVGVGKRDQSNRNGVIRWDQKGYSARDVGVKGDTTGPVLQKIIDMNRGDLEVNIVPSQIVDSDQTWRKTNGVEFFVDFETVSDLDDDFSKIPFSGGQTLIFMIGCGHYEEGEWYWECFTTDQLNEDSEVDIIDEWFDHMSLVSDRLGMNGENPVIFHWSHAEQSTFENAFNAARVRHPHKKWPDLNWYDFLKSVIKREPVVIEGSFGFGLKSVAGAMERLGFIETKWDAGPTDGLGAMVGAWFSAKQATMTGVSMTAVPLMEEITKYNHVDCKVMAEIINYLRKNH